MSLGFNSILFNAVRAVFLTIYLDQISNVVFGNDHSPQVHDFKSNFEDVLVSTECSLKKLEN